jgi:hypothetical protein
MFSNIVNVYHAVLELANKDQKGFVSAQAFNRFAQQSQLNIYNALFSEIEEYRRSSRQNINAKGDKSRLKQIEEDLGFFSKSSSVSKSSGVFTKPDDLSRIISISTAGPLMLESSSRVPIDICYDEEKIERILISDLAAPSESHPVALVSNKIEVFPSSISKILIRYYKVPGARNYLGERFVGKPTLNFSNNVASVVDSLHFELPEHYETELAIEIAKMIGVSIRDADVVSFSQAQQTPKMHQ